MALSSEASTEDIVQLIATKLNTTLSQVTKTLDLLNEGNTVPFIARYRKEKTGSLDETQIRSIEKEYQEQEQLIKEKKRVKEKLTTQGQLTDELLASIDGSYTKTELKEIYRPYKQKKKTKGTLAREQGFEPLAQLILGKNEWPEGKTLHDVVLTYINSEMGVESHLSRIYYLPLGLLVSELLELNLMVRHPILKRLLRCQLFHPYYK